MPVPYGSIDNYQNNKVTLNVIILFIFILLTFDLYDPIINDKLLLNDSVGFRPA